MRKRIYTRNVGVLLNEEIYQELINVTDELEATISEYIRGLIEKEIKLQKEK